MKGIEREAIYKVILLVLFLVVVFVAFVPQLYGFSYAKYSGLEKALGVPGSTEFDAPSITPTRPVIESLRKIDRSGAHYVSEIACSIAEHIYYDFTKYGEGGRNDDLIYIHPAGAFNEEFHCEWIPEQECCPTPLPTKLDEGKYRCLIKSGIFTVKSNEQLTDDAKDTLTDLGCSLDCKYADDREYRLDEMCINHNFADYNFPETSDISFCTDELAEYLRIQYDSIQERQKFGNRDCFRDSHNPWTTTCGSLCNAVGERDNGDDLTERDYDRIFSWKADQSLSYELANDKLLQKDKGIITGKKYFYTLYWNNNDDEEDDSRSKRYEIEFPSIITKEFTEIEDNFASKNDFLNFIEEFFDETSDVRNTTAGLWLPELRTEYDGIITLAAFADVTLIEIQNKLEGLGFNFLTYKEPCVPDKNCRFYAIEATSWAERITYETWLNIGKFFLKDESPVFIKYSANIDPAVGLEGKTKYRLIIRNWISNWYGFTRDECDKAYWCIDKNRPAGEKIFCTDDRVGDCNTAKDSPHGDENYKLTYPRYSDRSIIIIKLPECTETDGGKAYWNYGEVTVDDGIHDPETYKDACIDDEKLDEKYCSKSGEVESEIYTCSKGCINGACKL